MSRTVGTVVRGIRTPIIKDGDDLKQIVIDSVLNASKEENFTFNDRDIIAITEAVLGISTGNYATIDDIATDVKNKFNGNHIGIVFPILSRNRFAVCLRAFARAMDKITMLLSYPSDEVGNDILDKEKLEKSGINPYSDVISEKEYTEKFGDFKHIFTGVNMVDFYRDVANSENCEIEFVFSNQPEEILKYTDEVLACDIHTRTKTKEKLKRAGGKTVLGMDDILTTSINGSGYNSKYGLLGSNRATEEKVKLFPEAGEELVYGIQDELKKITGKTIEVMIYGDGAFKDPVGKIWELADPVVSPFYTKGLEGSPNELKLKYLSDNKYSNLKGEELQAAIRKEIEEKDKNLKGKIETQGTTPRRYTDLIGSLCDLTSGSGDKGTPVVFIQGYFDNYAN
ncbi:f420-0:Gamma-glutamyl ligase superfamily [Mycoplasma sp. CAG:877]|nr:f420-0:Gamma-glutamyl ligase superfamily [Mycoplasma sp. CAG:877]